MSKPAFVYGLLSGSRPLPALVVVACGLFGPLIAPAGAQDPERALQDRFQELLATEHQLRATFDEAQRALGSARAEHFRARSFVNRNCLGLPASDGPRGQADVRLRELEEQNSELQRREQDLSTKRQDLEHQRMGVERESSASGREQYRRQMWQWMNNYRNTYVGPFENEVVGGLRIYTEGVQSHATALRAIGETCRVLRASAPRQQPAEAMEWVVLTTVVARIQDLQNLLRGKTA